MLSERPTLRSSVSHLIINSYPTGTVHDGTSALTFAP